MTKKLQELPPDKYRITIAKSIQEVEKIRCVWEQMQWHPNTDIDFYRTAMGTYDEFLMPYVIMISENENPTMIAVGRIEKYEFDCNLGYRKVYKRKVRALTIVNGGILGKDSLENINILVGILENALKGGDAELVLISNLRVESKVFECAKKAPGILCRDHLSKMSRHWNMQLPDNVAAFLEKRSSKHRYWLRRIAKSLEKDYPGKVETRYFTGIEQVDRLCNDAEEVAKNTYQRGLNVGFVNDMQTRAILNLYARKEWLRGYVMYLEGRPCAFWIGRKYRDTFYLGYTGYNPDYEKYELGSILFIKMLEDLCLQKEIKMLDFGLGDASYKSRYGDQSWLESSVYIFPLSLAGVWMNIMRTSTEFSSQFLVRILNQLGLFQKIKRIWRNRVASKASN